MTNMKSGRNKGAYNPFKLYLTYVNLSIKKTKYEIIFMKFLWIVNQTDSRFTRNGLR